MDIKRIFLAICITMLVFEGNAKKTKSDKLAENKSESSEELESYESKSENSKEELPSGQKTKNYGVQEPNDYSKGRKVKKYDAETSEKHPQKNKKAKKYNGKSREEYSEKKSQRNKREAPKQMLTKIKKKELMDQENTGVDGEMMAPFESEIVFEKFERADELEPDQTLSMPKSATDEIVPPKKSKSIKKYNHLEGVKKGKMYNKEVKSEKYAKADKFFKEKPLVEDLTNEIDKP